jgi:hypothetical protein
LKACLKENLINNYLNTRNLKYNLQPFIIRNFNNKFIIPHYFPAWLSGFIEAKGNFYIGIKKDYSFSCVFLIGHNNDFYILKSIKNFFNIDIDIRNSDKAFYFVKIYNINFLKIIISHCILYPLLGQKSQSLTKFIKVYKK